MKADKRIFILGDSHSYTEYDRYLGNGFYSWTWLIDQYFENLEVHNFSVPGGNNLLTDMILRKLLVEYEPHTVILNLSGHARFLVPVGKTDLSWETFIIRERHKIYEINTKSFFRSNGKGVKCNSKYYNKNYGTAVRDLVTSPSDKSVIGIYNQLFENTLFLYSKSIPNFFYWSFDEEAGSKNNINRKANIVDYLTKKYGRRKLILEHLDSTSHLTLKGAQTVFEEYILPSKIGKVLKELNDI